MKPVVLAARGKGTLNAVHRAGAIGARYGLGPRRMERRLGAVAGILERFGCGATLPVTAAVAARSPRAIARFAALGIEFAVHGYYHVDHVELTKADQREQLGRARRLLEDNGVPAVGFRAPYLRYNGATLEAVRAAGFLYDTSQAMNWPFDQTLETGAYRRALAFYGAIPARDHPVLPWLDDGIVRIPYCLPDDEAVLDRLRLSPENIVELWLQILRSAHRSGELFTLGVHPERIELCAPAIIAVLDAARAARPPVWIARLDEIARWWRARTAATVVITDLGGGCFRVRVRGPAGVTVFARGVEVRSGEPRAAGYVRIRDSEFELLAERRPSIGVHPDCPPSLTALLRDHGYIVEPAHAAGEHGVYLRPLDLSPQDPRSVFAALESGGSPLVRLGRWPDGAQSALSITGDVDALTIWDYAVRLLGR